MLYKEFILVIKVSGFAIIPRLIQNDKIPEEFFAKFLEANIKELPSYYKAFLYIRLGRKLEAIYYLEKHLNENPDDRNAWNNYLFWSSERGDRNSSVEAFRKIEKLGDLSDTYRAAVIYCQLVGNIDKAVEASLYLIDNKIIDDFTVSILFDLFLLSGKWIFIPYLINTEIGQKALKSSNQRILTQFRKVSVSRFIECLYHRIEEVAHE